MIVALWNEDHRKALCPNCHSANGILVHTAEEIDSDDCGKVQNGIPAGCARIKKSFFECEICGHLWSLATSVESL